MATDPKETTERKSEHRLGELGFTRIPPEEDPRRKNPELLGAIAKIAPGTGLREAVDDVIRSHEGALIAAATSGPDGSGGCCGAMLRHQGNNKRKRGDPNRKETN
jgi:hypothetical protein